MLRIAWQGVRGFPVRGLLTALSLTVGIVGLVSIYSASATIQATVEQKALLSGGKTATFDAAGLTGNADLNRGLTVTDQLRRSLGTDAKVVRLASSPAISLDSNGKRIDAEIVFAQPSAGPIRDFPVVEGAWLSEVEGRTRLQVVLNRAAAQSVGTSPRMEIHLRVQQVSGSWPVDIAGIVEDGSVKPAVYGNIADLPMLLVNQEGTISTTLEASAPDLTAESFIAHLKFLDEFSANHVSWTVTRRDTVGQLQMEVSATRSSFLTVGTLGVLATAFAVANVGLSALRERSSELSLRRALGARRWQIPFIMVLESQIVALLAGTFSIPLSLLVYPVIANQFGAPFGVSAPPFPWISAWAGLALGMLTAFLGSIAPALRALKIPISTMMRE
ncbi:ABC transporter permease [Paenarthrobacter sp. NPDC058040]|uniref:ABC transporter permease n=1 Tax=unclassified Paenarthrobacter TaxID=2634190 RepID=UPI0036DFA453